MNPTSYGATCITMYLTHRGLEFSNITLTFYFGSSCCNYGSHLHTQDNLKIPADCANFFQTLSQKILG